WRGRVPAVVPAAVIGTDAEAEAVFGLRRAGDQREREKEGGARHSGCPWVWQDDGRREGACRVLTAKRDPATAAALGLGRTLRALGLGRTIERVGAAWALDLRHAVRLAGRGERPPHPCT